MKLDSAYKIVLGFLPYDATTLGSSNLVIPSRKPWYEQEIAQTPFLTSFP